jgi:hypothetical protein
MALVRLDDKPGLFVLALTDVGAASREFGTLFSMRGGTLAPVAVAGSPSNGFSFGGSGSGFSQADCAEDEPGVVVEVDGTPVRLQRSESPFWIVTRRFYRLERTTLLPQTWRTERYRIHAQELFFPEGELERRFPEYQFRRCTVAATYTDAAN